jgi:small-conductance mechanosensitive channel
MTPDWIEIIRARPWLSVTAALAGAFLLGLLAHWIAFEAAERVARLAKRPLVELLLRRSRSPLRVLLPMAGMATALAALAPPSAGTDIARRVIAMTMIGSVAWGLVATLKAATDWLALRYRVDVQDNLEARRVRTQATLLRRTASTIVIIVATALALMQIPGVEKVGVSLLASAGLAGIVVAMAARPTLSNLFAGVQLALTQPIRLDDVVIVEGEWGRVEEITNTYVVVRIWDLRRLVVPLSHFIEKPFQNWTRASANLLGTVLVYADYSVPVDEVRQELRRILDSSPLGDRAVWGLQVTDAREQTIELRALMSATDSGAAWDLRCYVREKLIAYLQKHHHESLPRIRAAITSDQSAT